MEEGAYIKPGEHIFLCAVVFGHELQAHIEEVAARETRAEAFWTCHGDYGVG